MARLWSSGWELNTVGSSSIEWDQSFQGKNSQSSVVRSGAYAGESSALSSGSAQYNSFRFASANGSGPYFFRVYLNVATLPSAQNRVISLVSSTNVNQLYITLDNGGLLRLFDEDGQIGSASSALSTGTWYGIEMKLDRTAASGSHIGEAKIDGSTFATSSTRAMSVGVYDFRVGANLVGEAQTTGLWYWDDAAVNDSTGSFQTSYPGSGKIIHLRPNAAGDNTGLTTGVSDNTNHYLNVNEVTPNDDTTYNQTSTASQIDDYNIDSSGLSTSDTINAVSVGVRYRKVTSGTMVFNVRAKASSGGTVEASSNISSVSTSFQTNAEAVPRNYPLTMYDLPGASTTLWTSTDLDAAQIGVATVSNTANNWRVTTMWMLVDYTPSTIALTDTLTDTFTGGTINAAKWNNFGTSIGQSADRLQYTTLLAGEYGGITSVVNYNLTGSYAYAQLVDAGNQSLASLEVYPVLLQIDANNHVSWLVASNTISAFKRVAGTSTSLFSVAYSSTTHAWFRIRESAGTTYWDTSTDGTTWTNRHSVANPITVTNLTQLVEAGTYAVEASTTTAKFDNFNTTPAVASGVKQFGLLGVG